MLNSALDKREEKRNYIPTLKPGVWAKTAYPWTTVKSAIGQILYIDQTIGVARIKTSVGDQSHCVEYLIPLTPFEQMLYNIVGDISRE